MKRIISLILLLAFVLSASSCVVVTKDRPVRKVKVLKTADGDYVVIKKVKGVKKINVWRHRHKKGKPYRAILPGVKVKVIKFDGPHALIVLPSGDTAWIDAVYVR